MIFAARVGKMFGLDPVAVLRDEGDPLINQVRGAAAEIISDDEQKQAEQARAKAPRRR